MYVLRWPATPLALALTLALALALALALDLTLTLTVALQPVHPEQWCRWPVGF